MGKKKKIKTPPVVQRDPVAEQAAIDAEATRKANDELAGKRRSRRGSLLSLRGTNSQNSGSGSGSLFSSILARAKQKLGD